VALGRLVDRVGQDSGLDEGSASYDIHFEDSVHASGADEDAAGGDRSSRQAGSCPPRYEGHTRFMKQTDDLDELVPVSGKNRRTRKTLRGGERVGFVCHEPITIVDHRTRVEGGPQCREKTRRQGPFRGHGPTLGEARETGKRRPISG
jgi:hypothetical protein